MLHVLYRSNWWFLVRLCACVVTITCVAGPIKAQPQLSEEELLKALEIVPVEDHDSVYYELFKLHSDDQRVLAEKYLRKSNSLARLNNNSYLAARSYRAFVKFFYRWGLLDSARTYFDKTISYCKSSKVKYWEMVAYNDRYAF